MKKPNSRRQKHWGVSLASTLWCLGLSGAMPPSSAADRALLVGVGDYRLENAALPGIAKDLHSMHAIARSMGFPDNGIRVLRDRDATLAAIRIAFQRDLIRGVREGDRVLFYFSGHGTQVTDEDGDEFDGADEALMVYDTRKRYSRGKTKLESVLLDDELEALIKAIPATDVLVVVDACHSGTVTRLLPTDSGERQHVPKAYFYEGMPAASEDGFLARGHGPQRFNYVAISATQDDQLAIATENGSVFTNSVAEVFREAADRRRTLTPSVLVKDAANRIKEMVEPRLLFVPQLSGDQELAETLVLTGGT